MGNRDLSTVCFFGTKFCTGGVAENSSSEKKYMFSETTTYKVGK